LAARDLKQQRAHGRAVALQGCKLPFQDDVFF